MGYGVRLQVWGDYACFTRPELKVERVSYDVMTPSAARGIFEAVHWKPAIRWVIDRIHVMNEIRFENIRRNEVKGKISTSSVRSIMNGKPGILEQNVTEERQQRATLLLRNVNYVIEAHFEMTSRAGESDTPEKHYNIFLRRARNGQYFHHPYLGCREFPASFRLLEEDEPLPVSYYQDKESKDLGWMLHDQEFGEEISPFFFRAEMRRGVIEIPSVTGKQVVS